jgi:hypothetical protein
MRDSGTLSGTSRPRRKPHDRRRRPEDHRAARRRRHPRRRGRRIPVDPPGRAALPAEDHDLGQVRPGERLHLHQLAVVDQLLGSASAGNPDARSCHRGPIRTSATPRSSSYLVSSMYLARACSFLSCLPILIAGRGLSVDDGCAPACQHQVLDVRQRCRPFRTGRARPDRAGAGPVPRRPVARRRGRRAGQHADRRMRASQCRPDWGGTEPASDASAPCIPSVRELRGKPTRHDQHQPGYRGPGVSAGAACCPVRAARPATPARGRSRVVGDAGETGVSRR